GIGRRVVTFEVEHDTDLPVRTALANDWHSAAMRDEDVVRDLQRRWQMLQPGGMLAAFVAQNRHAPRLVEGRPVLDTVAKSADRHICIADKRVVRAPIRPAALVLQRLWQVPVV